MTEPVFPPGRYGRRRRRGPVRRWVRPVLTGCVVAGGVAGAAAYYSAHDTGASAQVIRIDYSHPRYVDVGFTVTKAADRSAVCTVSARDRYGERVGEVQVTVPPSATGKKSVYVEYRLTTTRQPNTGEVGGCAVR